MEVKKPISFLPLPPQVPQSLNPLNPGKIVPPPFPSVFTLFPLEKEVWGDPPDPPPGRFQFVFSNSLVFLLVSVSF